MVDLKRLTLLHQLDDGFYSLTISYSQVQKTRQESNLVGVKESLVSKVIAFQVKQNIPHLLESSEKNAVIVIKNVLQIKSMLLEPYLDARIALRRIQTYVVSLEEIVKNNDLDVGDYELIIDYKFVRIASEINTKTSVYRSSKTCHFRVKENGSAVVIQDPTADQTLIKIYNVLKIYSMRVKPL